MDTNLIKKLGPICGILAVIIFLSFTIVSYLLYPGYDIFEQTLSKLGSRDGSGIYFNIGLIVTGILFIPFQYSLYEWLPKENKSLLLVRSILGVAGALALIGVGLIPDVSGLEIPHNITAFTFFLLTGIAILIVSYELYSLETIEPAYTWMGYTCVGSALFYGIISVPFDVPIFQKVTVVLFLVWVVLFSLKMKNYISENGNQLI